MNTRHDIWLVRHGETAWSKTGQHTGWTDISLLRESEDRLLALQPFLGARSFALILSSPLQRAKRTAELVGLPSFQIDDRLKEWNYGAYDGKTKEEIRKQIPDWSIWTHGTAGGESIDQVADRARQVISRTREIPGDVALVAHGHLLRILAACWMGIDPREAEHLALSTGAICILGWEGESPVIRRWNWQPPQIISREGL